MIGTPLQGNKTLTHVGSSKVLSKTKKKTDLAAIQGQIMFGCKKSKSRQTLTRQKTDEDIKKLYGIRKVDRETKHLDIMIEMAQTTQSGRSRVRTNTPRAKSKPADLALEHAETGQSKADIQMLNEKAMVSPEMRKLLS